LGQLENREGESINMKHQTTANATATSPNTLPTVIVLTSGRGVRFAASGGTVPKLQAMLGPKTVLDHTLDAVKASGLPWHLECEGLPGMGDSIAAGVRATQGAHGWLVLPGDLPLVQAATLRAVAIALAQHLVVIPVYQGSRGHPVGFAPACRDALLSLEGNQGAARIVSALSAIELIVDDAGIGQDVDTVQDLERLRFLLTQRHKSLTSR
jgi:molybdenum cofactor cytidylyltransferase